MNKIKDLIYNKSDILIALLILAVAALIIMWRLGIILEYPKEVIGGPDTENVLTEPEDESGEAGEAGESGDQTQEEGQQGEATGDQEQQGEASTGDNGESGEAGQSGEAGESGESGEATQDDDGPLFDGDKLTRDYEVNITGTTAYEAVQSMVEAGIFENYDEYKKICQDNGLDHEKMRAGIFTFKKGESKLEIVKEVNWS